MWDIKLTLIDLFFWFNLNTLTLLQLLSNASTSSTFAGFVISYSSIFYQFPLNNALIVAIKFCAAISFLVLIRGGTPRYRYDYLTKLGWLKFLSLVMVVFCFSVLVFFCY